MKKLYEFTLNQTVEQDETVTEKDSNGAEIKVTRKVQKPKPHKFCIIKPNRSLIDDADFFYAKTFSRFVKEGLLTIDGLQTKLSDDGGILSKAEVKNYEELKDKINTTQLDYQKIVSENPKEEERNDDVKKQITELEELFKFLVQIRQEFENQKQSLYQHTAEFKTRNKTIFWWIINLSYKENEKGETVPMFSGETYDDKLKKYDEIIEKEDEFLNEVVNKFILLVTFWNSTGETKKEEFDKLLEPEKTEETLKSEPNDKK